MNAIRIEDGRAYIGEECRGCGGCFGACPYQAITIIVPDLDAVDATFKRIEEAVAVK